MKYILISLIVTFSSVAAYSYVLEAKPVADLIRQIQQSKFEHTEDGLVFGFNSIKSCLYINQDLVILKNYCVPKKEYPAKGYTIISLKYGIIDLYQEEINSVVSSAGNLVIKHDIRISTFSDILKDHLISPLQASTIAGLNETFDKLYYLHDPACWSTNLSNYTNQPEVKCSTNEVLNFDPWAKETQAITGDAKSWKQLMEAVEGSITK